MKPILLIVNTYNVKLSPRREKRKKDIEELKKRNIFETVIIDYPNLCK